MSGLKYPLLKPQCGFCAVLYRADAGVDCDTDRNEGVHADRGKDEGDPGGQCGA